MPLASRSFRPLRALGCLLALAACGSTTTTVSHTAAGLVRDATTAKPIGGAEVDVADGTAVHTLTTGSDGTFQVDVAGSSGTITVQAEGYVRASLPYDLTSKNPRIYVSLQPAGRATTTPSPLG